MKIGISGASGFLGSQLAPCLKNQGHELFLFGRDKKKLSSLFPGEHVFEYQDMDELQELGIILDYFLHLAAINSNSKAKYKDFEYVNKEFLLEIANKAKAINARNFVNFSTMHCLDKSNFSNYAKSKREGMTALNRNFEENYRSILIPFVYGEKFPEKLFVLNYLPQPISNFCFKLIKPMKPVASIDLIAESFVYRDTIADIPNCIFEDKSSDPVYCFIKRLLDISLALFLSIAFFWAFSLIALIIKLSDGGSIFFSQNRVGLDGKSFTCYKFRTMKEGTKSAGTHEVCSKQVTGIGAVLRRIKVDELPQLWNIIKNDMSFIGPRPCLETQGEVIKYRQLVGGFKIKPGISGWAQVNNIDMSEPKKLARADYEYLALRSLLFDLALMVYTFAGRGRGDNTRS